MTRTYKNVRTATAVLGESQLKFRLGLARQRTQLHPLDSMDFIMMDLEDTQGQTSDNPVELIMKDVSTVRYQPQRFWEWAAIPSRLAEKYA